MKRINIIFIIIILLSLLINPLLCLASQVEANSLQKMAEKQLQVLDVREVEKLITQIDEEMNQFIPQFSINEAIKELKNGNIKLKPQEILNGSIKYLLKEVGANLTLMGKLVLLSVICAVLANLQNAFEKGTIAKLAHAISFLVLITLVISSFQMTMEIGKQAIEKMVTFMQALMPVLLTLLAALGAFTTTAILHPFILVTLGVLSTLFSTIIFPLIYLEAVLKIVNNISDKFKVSRLAGLLKEATMFFLGLSLTLFIGALSIQGVGGAIADGISLRTAKFMTGAFIPVVGGMFADVLEAIIGGSLLLKNAVGLVGLMVIGFITLFPVLKILAIVIIYKIAAALIQSIGDPAIADTIQSMGNSLLMVFAAVATVALMFFLAIIIIVTTANITVMLR
ncbi:MAG: stage sporulation protein [Clostridia bacterium]|jgi:stage III sporulation protein AE|nr:stage sporulation protein [Clostridia bacterium]MDN5323048.1 stage sporulation protein [Clostridia bacterium]